jgi:hypothetical protein
MFFIGPRSVRSHVRQGELKHAATSNRSLALGRHPAMAPISPLFAVFTGLCHPEKHSRAQPVCGPSHGNQEYTMSKSQSMATLPAKAQGWLKEFESHATSVKRGLAKAEVGIGRVKDATLIAAGGCMGGAAQGLFGKASLNHHIRADIGMDVDLDLMVPLAVLGLGVADLVGEYSDDAVLLASGALAHYGGNFFREQVAAKTVGGNWGD